MFNILNFIENKNLLDENAPKILLPHQFYYPQMSTIKDRASERKVNLFQEYLSNDDAVGEMMIYIHIPFCDSHCSFCSFDKAYDMETVNRYVAFVINEMEYYSRFAYFKNMNVASIHFGGGTPTILPPEKIECILNSIYRYFSVKTECIINIEGSVSTLCRDDVAEYIKESGFSRVSVGVQTFDKKTRIFYGSVTGLAEVYKTLDLLKKKNIVTYIDIMYGYPIYDISYSDYKRCMQDIKVAIDYEVEGIEFGQLYPYYNRLEKIIQRDNLLFPGKEEVIQLIQDASQLMYQNGYKQQTEYAFIRSKGNIILENAYYGANGKNTDCLAIGSSAFGKLGEWKYRNMFYKSYMQCEAGNYLQIKKLDKYENKMYGIVGFPKTLGINKMVLERTGEDEEFLETLQYMINTRLLADNEADFRLTEKGKCIIDNLYMALLSEEERKHLIRETKIHCIF